MIYLVLRHAADATPLTFDIVTLYSVKLTDAEQVLAVRRLHAGVHDQGADGAAAHLAAGRAHRGADRRLGRPRRRAAQDGRLRASCASRCRCSRSPPEQAFPLIMALAVDRHRLRRDGGAILQPDMKRLVAYSSVEPHGLRSCSGLYAFNNTGVTGGVLQMVNHGLSTGALFILVGYIYDRTPHAPDRASTAASGRIVPICVGALPGRRRCRRSACPGPNGFVGEFLILLGAFRAHPGPAASARSASCSAPSTCSPCTSASPSGRSTREANRTLTRPERPREILVAASHHRRVHRVDRASIPGRSSRASSRRSTVLLGRLERAGATRHLEAPGPPPSRLAPTEPTRRPLLDLARPRKQYRPFMANILTRVFGSANERTIKRCSRWSEIAALEEEYRAPAGLGVSGQDAPEWTARSPADEVSLDELLPEAFAVVREAARRTHRLRHYDVQLMGGIVLHQGGIAEMKTGEGKTLVATLPVVPERARRARACTSSPSTTTWPAATSSGWDASTSSSGSRRSASMARRL